MCKDDTVTAELPSMEIEREFIYFFFSLLLGGSGVGSALRFWAACKAKEKKDLIKINSPTNRQW